MSVGVRFRLDIRKWCACSSCRCYIGAVAVAGGLHNKFCFDEAAGADGVEN